MAKLIPEGKDLASNEPDLIKEWDYEKNNGMTPDQFLWKSGQPADWKCLKCCHSWNAIISSRTHQRSGCPCCTNKVVVKGKNDLATVEEDLIKEWDYENNDGMTPDQFTRGSNQTINWICPKGHRWPARIKDRVGKKSGCPFCANKKVLKDFNDFEFHHPDLAKDWDYEGNEGKRPDQFIKGSGAEVRWKCHKCGYRWPAKISDRVNSDSGCPGCDGRVAIAGENDFGSSYPDLVKDWNYEKNGDKTPDMFTKHSGETIEWKCHKCGYEWPTTIHNRTSHGSGCPRCADKVLILEQNDLLSQRPDLVEEWDFEINELKTPDQYRKSAHDEVGWVCKVCGHKWKKTIHQRVFSDSGCPSCAGRKTTTPRKVI